MKFAHLIHILLSALTFFACTSNKLHENGQMSGHTEDSLLVPKTDSVVTELTRQQIDSLYFRLVHHYDENFNFCVKADSLVLIPKEGDMITDTCIVYCGDFLVVADIKSTLNDSIDTIWVKVARDQMTMGWISETVLLEGAVPDDPISKLLDAMTGSRSIWMSAIVGIGIICFLIRRASHKKLQIIKFGEMDSFYPPLFLMLVAVTASLYATVQNFLPEFWQEFYFHPTLNPFELPNIMAALVISVWLMTVVFIAVIEEVYRHFHALSGITYLLEMTGVAMIVYLFISWTTLYLVGYIFLPLFLLLTLFVYFRFIRQPYICGNCEHRLHKKGTCPYCGAENK
ncbi:MAG: zinc ribbon domain-containing protein [Bacteroides sp.]|nr:hypothetical protein [Roseburia sp.]MCM1346607.1 zinc ribbon domain-containing protein [Bacteroides sp.]MCM1421149.1 zinc ribbon domain-containing protein [Bacteroides sp.]